MNNSNVGDRKLGQPICVTRSTTNVQEDGQPCRAVEWSAPHIVLDLDEAEQGWSFRELFCLTSLDMLSFVTIAALIVCIGRLLPYADFAGATGILTLIVLEIQQFFLPQSFLPARLFVGLLLLYGTSSLVYVIMGR